MPTEFTVGVRTECSDGYCRQLSRITTDPATRKITHLVIKPEHRLGSDRLVPVELVDMTASDISLRCTLAEFEKLQPAAEIDPAEAELIPGHPVHATDGEIGQVEGLVIDPRSHHVTHVLLQEGHLWGRKEVAIPISAVTGVDDGIQLNITKREVQDLPPVDIDHPDA
jgi:sporulation protein YlmC with PRC-barrel domain